MCYARDGNALYKWVNLETGAEDTTKSTVDDEHQYGMVSYSDDESNGEPRDGQPRAKLVDDNYEEKLTSWLNGEFVKVGVCGGIGE